MFTDDPNCHEKRTAYNRCRRGSWYMDSCKTDWHALETCNRKNKDEHYERFLTEKLKRNKRADLTDADEKSIRDNIHYWKGEGDDETVRDLESFLHLLARKKRRKTDEMKNHRYSSSPAFPW